MRRHALDPISLTFGAVFTALGLVFLLTNVDLGTLSPAWAWPIPLMVVGVLVIALALGRGRGRTDQRTSVAAATTTVADAGDQEAGNGDVALAAGDRPAAEAPSDDVAD
jgi:hypothetical protein